MSYADHPRLALMIESGRTPKQAAEKVTLAVASNRRDSSVTVPGTLAQTSNWPDLIPWTKSIH